MAVITVTLRRSPSVIRREANNTINNSLLAYFILLFPAIFVAFAPNGVLAGQSNKLTEIEIGESLEKTLGNEGTAVWLNDSQSKFFSIYTPVRSGLPQGGAILLHDAVDHPDAVDVIRPLRTQLPFNGWATLSIQLPLLDHIEQIDSHQQAIALRINKAIDHLRSQGLDNLVLIGHGTGAVAAASFIKASTNSGIQAFVGISLALPKSNDQQIRVPELLEDIPLPILDIYGSQDLEHVTTSADKRAMTARQSSDQRTATESFKRSAMATNQSNNIQGYIVYRQIKVQGADHDFRGLSDTLIKRVIGWLDRHAKGVTVNTTN